jgi:hypothetical protein
MSAEPSAVIGILIEVQDSPTEGPLFSSEIYVQDAAGSGATDRYAKISISYPYYNYFNVALAYDVGNAEPSFSVWYEQDPTLQYDKYLNDFVEMIEAPPS